MQYRKLGRTGLDVSLLGLGTVGARQMATQGHPVQQQHALAHLESNAAALEHPRLPDADTRRLAELFGQVNEFA